MSYSKFPGKNENKCFSRSSNWPIVMRSRVTRKTTVHCNASMIIILIRIAIAVEPLTCCTAGESRRTYRQGYRWAAERCRGSAVPAARWWCETRRRNGAACGRPGRRARRRCTAESTCLWPLRRTRGDKWRTVSADERRMVANGDGLPRVGRVGWTRRR